MAARVGSQGDMDPFETLSRQVAPRVRSRGERYFRQGRVQISSATPSRIDSSVRGSRRYLVSLERRGARLGVTCSCPYFDSEMDPCKHVWATILQAQEQESWLEQGEGKRPATLVPENRVRTESRREDVADGDTDEDDGGDDGGGDDNMNDDMDDDLTGDDEMVCEFCGKNHFDEDPDDFAEEAGEPIPRLPAFRVLKKPLKDHRAAPAPRPERTKRLDWKAAVAECRSDVGAREEAERQVLRGATILYFIDLRSTMATGGLVIEILSQARGVTGRPLKPRPIKLLNREIPFLPGREDRLALALMAGVDAADNVWRHYVPPGYESLPHRCRLSAPAAEVVLPLLCATGRLRVRRSDGETEGPALRWDDGPPWALSLSLRQEEGRKSWLLEGGLVRDNERIPLAPRVLLLSAGVVIFEERAARLADCGSSRWISLLRQDGPRELTESEGSAFVADVMKLPRRPLLDLPEVLRWEEVHSSPAPRLAITKGRDRPWDPETLDARLSFDYEGKPVPEGCPDAGILEEDSRRVVLRDRESEARAASRLVELGLRRPRYGGDGERRFELRARIVPEVVRALVPEGWRVEAEGKLYRCAGAFRVEVISGVDWFELRGGARFDEQEVPLPRLLAALRKGDKLVRLDDGTFGILPEEWLERYAALARLGEQENGELRFRPSQVSLLDVLLAESAEVRWDDAAEKARRALLDFHGIKPGDPSAGFVGTLRDYQREGLGWMHFLRRFGLGGCLADDMGLGKTVEVLALLASRADEKGRRARKPSLVVVPRSLVFNWKREAARFAPGLRLLEHAGLGRSVSRRSFSRADLVLTTYGTLRRDAAALKDIEFDTVVLDEAQAVKNANTQAARATRLLRADHRLALSGTPIENHLGELWSLMEFLNPGMLGSASIFRTGGGSGKGLGAAERAGLARALRPFILRRTKEQVARELPLRLEQTLYCELEPEERSLYDELREHYRRSLLARVARSGVAKSKIYVLEALLRLRQAALHPGLLDGRRAGDTSAKLEVLMARLREVIEEEHKALVFSQFTSLLAILRDRLDREGLSYAYLDGQTRDRESAVAHFQDDPSCKLFLISLKAGGLGLNLTAAEYVFLLDPWWNPAVEAQAIDRAHRIGQSRRVFAYRLVARGTVEERILELQESKRELAEAIIQADRGLLRDLTREDLEALLA